MRVFAFPFCLLLFLPTAGAVEAEDWTTLLTDPENDLNMSDVSVDREGWIYVPVPSVDILSVRLFENETSLGFRIHHKDLQSIEYMAPNSIQGTTYNLMVKGTPRVPDPNADQYFLRYSLGEVPHPLDPGDRHVFRGGHIIHLHDPSRGETLQDERGVANVTGHVDLESNTVTAFLLKSDFQRIAPGLQTGSQVFFNQINVGMAICDNIYSCGVLPGAWPIHRVRVDIAPNPSPDDPPPRRIEHPDLVWNLWWNESAGQAGHDDDQLPPAGGAAPGIPLAATVLLGLVASFILWRQRRP